MRTVRAQCACNGSISWIGSKRGSVKQIDGTQIWVGTRIQQLLDNDTLVLTYSIFQRSVPGGIGFIYFGTLVK